MIGRRPPTPATFPYLASDRDDSLNISVKHQQRVEEKEVEVEGDRTGLASLVGQVSKKDSWAVNGANTRVYWASGDVSPNGCRIHLVGEHWLGKNNSPIVGRSHPSSLVLDEKLLCSRWVARCSLDLLKAHEKKKRTRGDEEQHLQTDKPLLVWVRSRLSRYYGNLFCILWAEICKCKEDEDDPTAARGGEMKSRLHCLKFLRFL